MLRRVIVSVLLASVALVGCAHKSAPTHTQSNVSSFNDGFADSKQDDCAQGFVPACEWAN